MTKLLDPIKNVIGWLLNAIYSLPPHNLGVAIIVMTMAVMAVMLPLTAKQVRSMVAMQKLQPEIKRIQQQYKDDKQEQSQAIMAFYKENQINPLSGCLPLLVQFPVWISLYETLKDLPAHLDKNGRLYETLCHNVPKCDKNSSHALRFLGMNLRFSLFNANQHHVGFAALLPYGLLVGFVVATGIVQTRQTMTRQKRQNPDQQINPQMQSMMRVMPLLNLMTILFPTGVALYWGARNVWMIGQQHFVLNKFYESSAGGAVNVRSSEVGPKAKPGPNRGLPEPAAPPNATNGSNGANGSKALNAAASEKAAAAERARANPNTSKKKQQRRKR